MPVTLTLTDTESGATQTFNGNALVQSRYAGLGDSYSSGEGAGWPPPNPHPNLTGCDFQPTTGGLYEGGTDHIDGAHNQLISPLYGYGCYTADAPHPLTGDTCHRAITAYAHVVERLLAIDGMTLTLRACSGGVVNNAYLDANTVFQDHEHQTGTPPRSEPPQVQSLGRDVSLITLTMGGNNVGFPDLAKACVTSSLFANSADCVAQDNTLLSRLLYNTTPGDPHDGEFQLNHSPITPGIGTLKELAKYSDDLNNQTCMTSKCFGTNLHDALVLLYRELRSQAPGARILVLGFPRFFPSGGTGAVCQHFTQFDQSWINDRIGLTDQVIEDAALESGVAQYVDVYEALNVHEECAGSPSWHVDPTTHEVGPCIGEWINGIDIAAGALGTEEVLHPNPCGHQAEGQSATNAYKAGPNAFARFDLAAATSQTTTIPVRLGVARLTVTLQGVSGSLAGQLTDPAGNPPAGNTHGFVQSGPTDGPIYTTWTVWQPPPGAWTLKATNTTLSGLGVAPVQVLVGYSPLGFLPPAGLVHMFGESCTVHGVGHTLWADCTASLGAFVSKAIVNRVASFEWFDQNGKYLRRANNETISGRVPFKVILKTNGAGGLLGKYRLTTFEVTCAVAGC